MTYALKQLALRSEHTAPQLKPSQLRLPFSLASVSIACDCCVLLLAQFCSSDRYRREGFINNGPEGKVGDASALLRPVFVGGFDN
jgi:hypothetical protein